MRRLLLLLALGVAVEANDGVCVEIYLEDSYGDGWNNGLWTILDDATGIDTGTLESGFQETDFKCGLGITSGGCFTFKVSGGSYPDEISWTMSDFESKELIVSGGAPYDDEVCVVKTADPTTSPTNLPTNEPSYGPTPGPTPLPTLPCEAGSFLNSSGAGCQLCPVGRHSSAFGAVLCSICPFGRIANVTGSTNCTLCPR